MLVEDAQLNWCKGEFELAMKLMHTVLHSETSLMTRIQARGIYGGYLAETCTENPDTIIEEYLTKSIKLSKAYAAKKASQDVRQQEDELKKFDLANQERNYKAIAKCRQLSLIPSKKIIQNF